MAPDRGGTDGSVRPEIVRRRVVDSTQDIAFALAGAGAADGTAVAAESQRAGRGRRGRIWRDEPGASLLCSIVVRPRVPVAQWPLLSLVAGVAVSCALERAAGVASRLKWPNDVTVDGRKIAGILLESRPATAGAVVVGIGINVAQDRFPPELESTATSVRLVTGRSASREALLEILLEEFSGWRRRLEVEGFGPVRDAWKARSATLGAIVRAGAVTGRATDLDETGALVIADLDGTGAPAMDGGSRHRVTAGEVVAIAGATGDAAAVAGGVADPAAVAGGAGDARAVDGSDEEARRAPRH
jgi:BirA family biotin operon repressor/biotin-[acetyl-CoA-carboxylase] ligase